MGNACTCDDENDVKGQLSASTAKIGPERNSRQPVGSMVNGSQYSVESEDTRDFNRPSHSPQKTVAVKVS